MKAFFLFNMVMCTLFVSGMELDGRTISPAKNNSPSKNNSRITITSSTEGLGVSKGTRPRSSEVTPITRRTGSFSVVEGTNASLERVRSSSETLMVAFSREENITPAVQAQLLKNTNK